MTETELYAEIEDRCDELGLIYQRNPDSRRIVGCRGFPDYVISGRSGTLFREVKDARSSPSPDQRVWGDLLMAGGMNWGVWRPGDLISRRILKELRALT